VTDHKWKISENRPSPTVLTTLESGKPSCKVIIFNDETHRFNEVSDCLIKAINCTDEQAENLTLAAHYDGACVFEGSYQECCRVHKILEEGHLDTIIEITQLEPEDNPENEKILFLLHRPEDSAQPLRNLAQKLQQALGCTIDRAKYTLRMTALTGRMSLHLGSFSELITLKNILDPFCTEIREANGDTLGLFHRCIMTMCNPILIPGTNQHVVSTHLERALNTQLPEELIGNILQCSFRTKMLNLELLTRAVSIDPHISYIDFSIKRSYRHALPIVDDQWCQVLSHLSHIVIIDLSGCNITSMGVRELSRLPNMTHLYMRDVPLQDIGIPTLFTGFNKLEVLDLNGCVDIIGECAQSIQDLPFLNTLNILDTSIPESVVSLLQSRTQNLIINYSERRKSEKNCPLEEAILIAFENVKKQLPNNPNVAPHLMEQMFLRELYSLTFSNAQEMGWDVEGAMRRFMYQDDIGQEEEEEEEEDEEDNWSDDAMEEDDVDQ